MTELDWYKNNAEMRGKCDYCGKVETLLAFNIHGLWNCYECFTKMDKPKQESHEKES